jgi:hypothetical protein
MADRLRERRFGRPIIAFALLGGIAAVAVAMAAGLAPGLVETIARPPPIVRAALAGGSIVVGGRWLLSALTRIDRSVRCEPGNAKTTRLSDADLGMLVRGVRLVFLAAAAFAAAAGWVLGEPLPLIVALVIAGVDVVETSFLLLVAAPRDVA